MGGKKKGSDLVSHRIDTECSIFFHTAVSPSVVLFVPLGFFTLMSRQGGLVLIFVSPVGQLMALWVAWQAE